jgi:hypothetical protein
MVDTDHPMAHDPVPCLQRLREVVRRRLERSGCLWGGDEHRASDEKMLQYICFVIAKLATDPSGLSLVMNEVAMSDEQLSRLQAVPLTQCSRAERVRVWEGCLAVTADFFPEEIRVVQQHLGPGGVPPLARIPRWIIEAFVQWPSAPPSRHK